MCMRITLFKLLFLFSTIALAQEQVSLNVGGTISDERKSTIGGAHVSVTKNGKSFTSFLTSLNGTYYLYLPMGAEYVVSVSKAGYVKKFFTVSTLGVSDENAKKKFNVMVADLELIEHYPGVDYSLFTQPMNKYYYNPKIDNFEYDKKYLSEMNALVEEVKVAKKEAIQLAQQKAERNKKNAELAQQKAMEDERLAIEQAGLQAMESELAAVKKQKEEKNIIAPIKETTTDNVLRADALIVNTPNQSRRLVLLAKYQPGVTEEVIRGANVTIIQRVLVREEMAWVYHKKLFNWGGVACFRDGQPITESTFELETRKDI
jgi:hypothetical protein